MNTANFYGRSSSNSKNAAICIRRFPSPDVSEESDLSDSKSESEFSGTTIVYRKRDCGRANAQ